MARGPSMALGQYAALWAIGLIILIGVLGWLFGTTGGGVVVFIIGGAAVVFAAYVIGHRVMAFLLHGSISASSDHDSDHGGER